MLSADSVQPSNCKEPHSSRFPWFRMHIDPLPAAPLNVSAEVLGDHATAPARTSFSCAPSLCLAFAREIYPWSCCTIGWFSFGRASSRTGRPQAEAGSTDFHVKWLTAAQQLTGVPVLFVFLSEADGCARGSLAELPLDSARRCCAHDLMANLCLRADAGGSCRGARAAAWPGPAGRPMAPF